MRSVFAVLSLLAFAATADHLVFDSHLLKEGDVQGRVSVLRHVKFHEGEDSSPAGTVFGAAVSVVRFLHLVPSLHKVHVLSKDGFGSHSEGVGHTVKHHKFLSLPDHELLVDLVGLSDCRKWHAVLLRVWDCKTGLVSHKPFGGLKDNGKHVLHPLGTVDELVGFVREHGTLTLLAGLLKKGVPAHVLTHKLHHHLKHLL